jgi:hypothetical protein
MDTAKKLLATAKGIINVFEAVQLLLIKSDRQPQSNK